MSSEPSRAEIPIDLGTTSIVELNRQLREIDDGGLMVRIVNAKRHDYIGCGLRNVGQATISGPIGDYCWGGITSFHVIVEGNVNHACGFGLCGGSILIQGNAGDALACFARSGWVATYGSCGDRCGTGLQGAEVIIRGSVGNEAAYGMRSGTLVVGGGAGLELGREMSGGTLFVRGEIQGIAKGIEEFRLKEADRFRLSLLMLKAGIKADGKDFRGYRRGSGA